MASRLWFLASEAELESGEGGTCLTWAADSQPSASMSDWDEEAGATTGAASRRAGWLWRPITCATLMVALCMACAFAVQQRGPRAAHVSKLHRVGSKVAEPWRGRALIVVLGNYSNPQYDRHDPVAQNEVKLSKEIAENLGCKSKVLTNAFNDSVDVSSFAITAFIYENRKWIAEGDFGVMILSGHGEVGAFYGHNMGKVEEIDLEEAFGTALPDKPKVFFYAHCQGEHAPPVEEVEVKYDSTAHSRKVFQKTFRFTSTAPGLAAGISGGNSPFIYSCAKATERCANQSQLSIQELSNSISGIFVDFAKQIGYHSTQTPQLQLSGDADTRSPICGLWKHDAAVAPASVPAWDPKTTQSGSEVCARSTVWEFQADADCAGNDIETKEFVKGVPCHGRETNFDMCAELCALQDECVAFEHQQTWEGRAGAGGVPMCWLKRGESRNSPSRGLSCPSYRKYEGSSYFTKLPGLSCDRAPR